MRVDIPIELGGGWAEIRDHLSWAQTQRYEQAGVVVIRRDDGSVVMGNTFDMYEHFVGVLEAWVSAWSLVDENGAPVPANRSGIESPWLTTEVGDFLFARCKEAVAASQRTKSGTRDVVAPA
jgi:hypothetical protein